MRCDLRLAFVGSAVALAHLGCLQKVTELELEINQDTSVFEPDDTGSVDSSDPVDTAPVEQDQDGDGFVESEDCDDSNAQVNPDAEEVCDTIDNDCDDRIDDEDDSLDLSSALSWYADADGDGYGDASLVVQACLAPEDWVADNTDCDDENADINPGEIEECNWIDDDCLNGVDDGLPDLDVSGVADCKEVAVVVSAGFLEHADEGECDGGNYMEREIQEIESFLGSMGLSVILFKDTGESPVTHGEIAPYPVVMYHNGGWAESGSVDFIDALSTASTAGQSLFFLGDDLGNHASKIEETMGKDTLYKLAYISEYFSNTSDSAVGVADAQHPVMSGAYGTVGSFEYFADIDEITAPESTADVLMTSGLGNPVVVAAENGSAQRTLSMIASIHNSHDCPIADGQGRSELEALFKNGIAWLQGWP